MHSSILVFPIILFQFEAFKPLDLLDYITRRYLLSKEQPLFMWLYGVRYPDLVVGPIKIALKPSDIPHFHILREINTFYNLLVKDL